MKAVWNGETIAESNDIVTVESNAYFPFDAVKSGVLQPSTSSSVCPWKGTAGYYAVAAGGKTNPDAAWFYADPKAAAKEIKGRIAFWKGVIVSA